MANGDVLAELWPGSVYQCRINEVIFSGSILVLVFFLFFSYLFSGCDRERLFSNQLRKKYDQSDHLIVNIFHHQLIFHKYGILSYILRQKHNFI